MKEDEKKCKYHDNNEKKEDGGRDNRFFFFEIFLNSFIEIYFTYHKIHS